MLKAYKYRIYPNKEQIVLLNKTFGCCRFVYNWALNKKIEAYKKDKTNLSAYQLIKEITYLKKQKEYEWLTEVSAGTLQQSILNMGSAFNNFFKKHNKYPKFKKKTNRQSFKQFQRIRVEQENSLIRIPKVNLIKYTQDNRTIEGKIKQMTVSKTPTNKYFVSVLVDTGKELPQKPKIKEQSTIGIDLGLKHFAILSDGIKFDNPKYLKNDLTRLKVLQRRASRKQKGSNNRKRANLFVARRYEKIANRRNDFLHKLTTKLVCENQAETMVVEDLAVSNLIKNHKLAQAISDVSWSEFVKMLEYKCDWYGKNFIKIGKYDPSSKMCCKCGYINNDLKLSQREWTCPACKNKQDRDIGAAINIKNIGLYKAGAGCSGERSELPALVGAMKDEKCLTN